MNKSLRLAVELFGWYGALAVLGAYTAHTWKLLDSGFLYQFLNCTGATGVGIAALTRRSYQAATLEFAWALVALAALLRLAMT
jgi:hypothetical protein